MSLEISIESLASAINTLATTLASLKASDTPTAAPQEKPAPVKKEKEEPAKKPAVTPNADTPPTVAEVKVDAPEKKDEPSEAKSSGSTTEVDFQRDISKPIVWLAGNGKRDVAVGILKQFGATKASEIKPEDYAAAAEAVRVAMAAVR